MFPPICGSFHNLKFLNPRWPLFLIFGSTLLASPPAWWSDPQTGFLIPGAQKRPKNPVAECQLKNVAKKATLYLDTVLPAPGAGAAIHAMVAGFHPSNTALAPQSLAQLKFVSKPFYVRLQGLGFDTKQSLINHGAPGWVYDYPWNPNTPKAKNKLLAGQAQLKWCFSFDLSNFQVVDSDGDGLTNAFEMAHPGLNPNDPSDAEWSDMDADGLLDRVEVLWGTDFTDADFDENGIVDLFDDWDADSLTNEEEAAFHLNAFSSDSDGDSMSDSYELANDLDPTNAADAAQDPDEDGASNAQEAAVLGSNPKDQLEPDPTRKVELWYRTIQQEWNTNTHTWKPEQVGAWTCIKWQGAQSIDSLELSLSGLGLGVARSRGEYYFKNLGPNGAAKIKWVTYEDAGRDVTHLNPQNCEVAVGAQSQTYTMPYPIVGEPGQGILKTKVYKAEAESGFDDFEHHVAPGNPPALVEYPWIMVPVGQHNTFKVKGDTDHLNPLAVGASAAGLSVTPEELPWNQAEETEIKLEADTEGDDAYVTLSALNETDPAKKIKIARAVRLSKIQYTVQPYKVIRHVVVPNVGTYDDEPENLPSRQGLEDRLNEIYEKQMNVHFTVLPFVTLGPLDYDIGAGADFQAEYPKIQPNFGTLDFLHDQSKTTDEEGALYAAGHNNGATVVNLYFLPGELRGHGTDPNFIKPWAGYARRNHRAGLIAAGEWLPATASPEEKAKVTAKLLETAAHEIGHLKILNGEGLEHPRPWGILSSSNTSGFPLLKQSDDMKRLMWWCSDRTGVLLIKEEWMKWRTGQQ